MKKYGCTKDPSKEKGNSPSKPSSSRDNVNITWGEDFPGYRLQEWSIPSENVRDPQRKPGYFGTINNPKESHQTQIRWSYHPRTGAETPKDIKWERQSQLMRKHSTISPKSLEPPFRKRLKHDQNICGQLRSLLREALDIKNRRGELKNRAESLTFHQKKKVLEIHLVKINKPKLGILTAMMYTSGKIWEDKPPCQPTLRRAMLTSARKTCIPSKDASTSEKKCMSACPWMNL